jgi:ABC-type lipoprotein export system ATPase subunit
MLISLDHITKSYTGDVENVVAVDDISVSVDSGEFVAVVGPSGCGKTTLLLVAGGLLRPDSGQVTIDGADPYSLSTEQRARFRAERIGFVFQQFHLVPYLNVLDNVLAPALVTGDPTARQRADGLVQRFGLADRVRHRPGQLSTGERQRVALARALLNEPKVILADEPTGNLDGENSDEVLKALQAFANEGGAVLLVTHDPNAVAFAGRKVVLAGGQLAESVT